MRILVNAMSAKSGGIATYTRNISRSFRERGLEASFAVSNEFELDKDISVVRLPANRMSNFKRVLWEQTYWRKIVNYYKPDVLFSSANFGLLKTRTPQVLLMREGGLFDPFYLRYVGPSANLIKLFERIGRRRLILASARASSVVMTPSESTKTLIVSADQNLEGRIIVNPYGTKLDQFNSSSYQNKWKKDKTLRLLYVSVYYPHKMPGLVSEAVAKLNADGIKTHLTLTMSMDQLKNTAGNEKDYLLLKKGIERNQLTLLGSVSYEDLPLIYSEHDIFVFPSISETFGHPLAEAMSMGLPVIASDTYIHREVCGNAAIYYPPLLLSELVKKIKEVHDNRALRNKLSKNGIAKSKQYFSWENHVDRLISIFRKF